MTNACETCKGTRLVDCAECEGHGTIWHPCDVCNDTDYIGNGQMGCACQTAGDVECEEADCDDGKKPCSECGEID